MTVLAVDPGPTMSAFVLWNGRAMKGFGKWTNESMHTALLAGLHFDVAVFEQVASYGMAVGAEVFETVFWTGRLYEVASENHEAERMFRRDVKLHLCGQARAKDANVRQALIDRFGGKEVAIGKKATPGPLFGIKADCWQALALAVTWHDQRGGTR